MEKVIYTAETLPKRFEFTSAGGYLCAVKKPFGTDLFFVYDPLIQDHLLEGAHYQGDAVLRNLNQGFWTITKIIENAEGWITWEGSENPVPGQAVEFEVRWGERSKMLDSSFLSWRHCDGYNPRDIVKYRVVEEKEQEFLITQPITTNDFVSFNTTIHPKHYQIFSEYGLEVDDVSKRIGKQISEDGFDMSFYEFGWWQQSIQYMLRFHKKNGLEDLKKAHNALGRTIASMEERKNI